jgi:hypothetical protein
MIVGGPVAIRTGNFPNTFQERYRLSQRARSFVFSGKLYVLHTSRFSTPLFPQNAFDSVIITVKRRVLIMKTCFRVGKNGIIKYYLHDSCSKLMTVHRGRIKRTLVRISSFRPAIFTIFSMSFSVPPDKWQMGHDDCHKSFVYNRKSYCQKYNVPTS